MPDELSLIDDTEVKQIIEACISWEPADRPTAEKMLKFPFFYEMNDEKNHHPIRMASDRVVYMDTGSTKSLTPNLLLTTKKSQFASGSASAAHP